MHAPHSVAGAAAWQAAGATVAATDAGLDLGEGFVAVMVRQGLPAWVAVEWLGALRAGIHAAAAKKRKEGGA